MFLVPKHKTKFAKGFGMFIKRFNLIATIVVAVMGIVGCVGSVGQRPLESNETIEPESVSPAGATSSETPYSPDLVTPAFVPSETLPLSTMEIMAPSESVNTLEPTTQPTLQFLDDLAAGTPSNQQELNLCLSEVLDATGELLLEWLPLADNARQLAKLQCPVARLDLSQDGRWLVVTIENSVEFQIPDLSLLMIDTRDGKHLLLNGNINGWGHYFDWVSDSQLIWIEEDGSISIGNSDLSNNFEVPKPMMEVWYASANIGFARDIDGMWWRLDTGAGEWQPLDNLMSASGFGVSQDGSFGLSFGQGELWRLPTNWGGEATRIPAPELLVVGTDATPETVILQLGDSSNWYISTPVWYQDDAITYPLEGFVFDVEEQRLLSTSDLGLPDSFKIVGFDVSPDGQWFAALINDKSITGQDLAIPTDAYIVEADHLQSGTLVENVIPAGWNLGDASVLSNGYAFLLHNQGDLLNPYGNLKVMDLYSERDAILSDVEKVIGTASQYVFVATRTQPDDLLVFDLDGNLVGTFDVPGSCHIRENSISPTGVIYLFLEGGQCPFTIVEFNPR